MYRNIGKKIKILVTAVVIFVSLIFIAYGIFLIFDEKSNTTTRVYGLCIAVIGPIIAWISGFIVYGFGEIVEKIDLIEKRLRIVDSEGELKKILEGQLNETDEEETFTFSIEEVNENNEDNNE